VAELRLTVREAKRLLISGRVQGVGYRRWAEREALRLGLSGWVRNRRDGSVEALVAGDAGSVAAFFDACRTGPPGAAVADVAGQPADDDAIPDGFSVLPTA
jgi:acylphosphatase